MVDLYVLDTSAIFTFTDQEPGADVVESLLDAAQANRCQLEACSISLMELYLGFYQFMPPLAVVNH